MFSSNLTFGFLEQLWVSAPMPNVSANCQIAVVKDWGDGDHPGRACRDRRSEAPHRRTHRRRHPQLSRTDRPKEGAPPNRCALHGLWINGLGPRDVPGSARQAIPSDREIIPEGAWLAELRHGSP